MLIRPIPRRAFRCGSRSFYFIILIGIFLVNGEMMIFEKVHFKSSVPPCGEGETRKTPVECSTGV